MEFINGKEYHRAHCDGLRDILVPVGKRYIIWSMDRSLNPNSSFVSEISKYMPQRENALKANVRQKRDVSPDPVDTAYRKVCKVKEAVINDCVKKVVSSIPSDMKDSCNVCFQCLKKADDATFHVVSTFVDVSLGNVVRGLDWLDKSAEMSGAGVRRYLRDGLGIDQTTAQNIGDGLEVGMKMLISIVPTRTFEFASNASRRLVKLTPAGGPSSGFKLKFYDENVIYKELKAKPGKVKSGIEWHKLGKAEKMQYQRRFLDRMIDVEKRWKYDGHKINGKKAYYCKENDLYYTQVKGEKCDFEVWKVTGKKARHQGAIEPLNGVKYEEARHPDAVFE